MNKEEYFKEVVESDRSWYSKRAKQYRRYHLVSRITIIAFSAITAFLAGQKLEQKDIIIGLLSSLTVIIAAVAELMKFKDQWMEYRSTAETMKREIHFFETGSTPYDKDDSFLLFVKNFESIKEQENQQWKTYMTGK